MVWHRDVRFQTRGMAPRCHASGPGPRPVQLEIRGVARGDNPRHFHSSFGRQAPAKVYYDHPRRVFHPLAMAVNWDAWVEVLEEHKVFKNNHISVAGESYTLPPGFIGTRMQVRKLEDRISSTGALVETFLRSSSDGASKNYVERVISKSGIFRFKRRTYYVGYKHADQALKVQLATSGRRSSSTRATSFLRACASQTDDT